MKKLIMLSALTFLGISFAFAAQTKFIVSPGGWYAKNNKQIDVQVVNNQGISLASGIITHNKAIELNAQSSPQTQKNIIGVQVSYTSLGTSLSATQPQVYCYNTKFLQNNQTNSLVVNDPAPKSSSPTNFREGPCF